MLEITPVHTSPCYWTCLPVTRSLSARSPIPLYGCARLPKTCPRPHAVPAPPSTSCTHLRAPSPANSVNRGPWESEQSVTDAESSLLVHSLLVLKKSLNFCFYSVRGPISSSYRLRKTLFIYQRGKNYLCGALSILNGDV